MFPSIRHSVINAPQDPHACAKKKIELARKSRENRFVNLKLKSRVLMSTNSPFKTTAWRYAWENPRWQHLSANPTIGNLIETSERWKAIRKQMNYDHKMMDVDKEKKTEEKINDLNDILRKRGASGMERNRNRGKEVDFDSTKMNHNGLKLIKPEHLKMYQRQLFEGFMKRYHGRGWKQRRIRPIKVCYIFFQCRFL